MGRFPQRGTIGCAIALAISLIGCSASSTQSSGGSPNPPPSNNPAITAWGDSLTSGNEDGSGATYPGALATLMGTTVNNLGVPNQTSTQIAVRMGAVSTTLTNDFIIPALNCAVAVTFQAGHEPAYGAPASKKSYYTGQGVLGTISGVQGYTVDDGNHNFTFTPTTCPSSAVTVKSGTSWTPVLDGLMDGTQIIWAGRNNYSNSATVLADISAMVGKLQSAGNKKYLVLSIPNGDTPGSEWKGDVNYNQIVSLNQALASTYGSHFLDIRAGLIAQYQPTAGQDVIDHSNDVPPASLRAYLNTPNGVCYAQLSSAITASDTTIPLGGPVVIFRTCRTLEIGNERIEVQSCTSASCTVYTNGRGWGSTTAAAHNAGAIVTGIDFLHMNTSGYQVVAKLVQTALQNLP